jgi:hypothetical protein
MNYEEFLKSKHIAERWGEAQAAFESIEATTEVAYYQELLNDFYDYIQDLERQLFITDQTVSPQLRASVPAPFLTSRSVPLPLEPTPSQGETLTGEEDPWFGFND